MFRSACPAAFARPSIYAAKRVSCGPGARFLPTKQFYIKMFVSNTVVIGKEQNANPARVPQVLPRRLEMAAPPIDRAGWKGLRGLPPTALLAECRPPVARPSRSLALSRAVPEVPFQA